MSWRAGLRSGSSSFDAESRQAAIDLEDSLRREQARKRAVRAQLQRPPSTGTTPAPSRPGTPPLPNPPVIMVDFDTENGIDTNENALEKAVNMLKHVEYDPDLDYFFNQIEIKMTTCGVKKQWTKLSALTTILPKKVSEELKPLLRKKESEFTNNDSYLQVKNEILRIFGQPDEAPFDKAMTRVLSDTPSALARSLVNDLCTKTPQLEGCCCKRFIAGLWRKQLPSNVRSHISSEPFTHENFNNITKMADDAFRSHRPPQASAAVAALQQAGATAAPSPPNPGWSLPGNSALDTAFHASFPGQAEAAAAGAAIAAYTNNRFGGRGRGHRGGRGNGRGNRGGRGGQGRGGNTGSGQGNNSGSNSGSGQAHPRHKTPRHADLPPFESCHRHWTYGKSAHFCTEPSTCPWKQYFIPKSNNQA